MNNRYNRSLKYMQHHELDKIFLKKKPLMDTFLISTVLTVILLYLEVKYSPALKAFDFALLANFLIYVSIIRPNIYKGRIKAYYRRKYNIRASFRVYSVLTMFSLGRVIGFSLYFFINDKSNVSKSIIENSHNTTITPAVSLISIVLLYLAFYHDKYVSIKEYSNEITYRRREHGMNKDEAIRDFLMMKDKGYNIKEYAGYYYDYDESKSPKVNKKLSDDENIEDEDTIRRSSRN